MRFKFDPYASNHPPEKDLTDKDVVFIHFEFDNYAPDEMELDNDGSFTIYRMVPPIDFNYYFTINGVPRYATDLEKEQILEEINVKLPYANVSQKVMKTSGIVNNAYIDKLVCKPRPPRKVIVHVQEDIPEPPEPEWDIRDSVFWGYMLDTVDLYNK